MKELVWTVSVAKGIANEIKRSVKEGSIKGEEIERGLPLRAQNSSYNKLSLDERENESNRIRIRIGNWKELLLS